VSADVVSLTQNVQIISSPATPALTALGELETGTFAAVAGAGADGSWEDESDNVSGNTVMNGMVQIGITNDTYTKINAAIRPYSTFGRPYIAKFEGEEGTGTAAFALPIDGLTVDSTLEYPDESGVVLTTGAIASVESLNAAGAFFEMGEFDHDYVDWQGYVQPIYSNGTTFPRGTMFMDNNSDGVGLALIFPIDQAIDAVIAFPANAEGTAGNVMTTVTQTTTALTELGDLLQLNVSGATQFSSGLTSGTIVTCAGADDGTGTSCALNSARNACNVTGGDCVFRTQPR
jgi:hypothetical protein